MTARNHIRYLLVAAQGEYELGKPLPLRASAGPMQCVPIAEMAPSTTEGHQQWYSLSEMARITGVSLSTIKREAVEKRLKITKVRRRSMVAHQDAMAYWASLCPQQSHSEVNTAPAVKA